MDRIVVKFGGSNLKDKDGLQKIINTITEYDQPLVIVVSAFYGITNLLSETLDKVLSDYDNIEDLTTSLTQMKKEVIHEFIPEAEIRTEIFDKITERLKKLERYLLGIHYIGDVPNFVEDIVLSYGERLSSLLLTSILSYKGFNCEEVLPEDMGLTTDGDFGNATINFIKSKESVKAKLSGEKIYIIPGFYGISEDKKVTLLGRGGSDYSAASIAKCINAKSLDVWKDVNGFLSADPNIVTHTMQIKKLDYTEAAELAYFGAKVLHPRTIEPLMGDNIPIRIFNINNTENGIKPYSVIENEGEISEEIIKSVTYSDDFCVLQLKGPGVGIKPGILAKVTGDFDNYKINIKTVITSQTSINFLLARKDLTKAYNHTISLKLMAVSNIVPINDVTLIALVGKGLAENHSIAGKTFGALSKEKINVKIICSGASEVATYFIVNSQDTKSAIKAIHKEFFE